jgi:hypothetical protein
MRIAILLAISGMFISSAALADVRTEIETAQDHAGLAIKAPKIEGVKMHLHHTLNCLVGPNGDGFDTKSMNPCAKAGAGAIPDSMSDKQKSALTQAAAAAKRGLATDDYAASQAAAKEAADDIASVN